MSTCTVTAQLNTIGAAAPGAAFVRLRLKNFSGFVPRILGTTVLVETQIDLIPDNTGAISQNVWGNDSIDPANTFYTCELWSGGRIVSSVNYSITGTAFNLNSAPILDPPNPPNSVANNILLQTNSVNNGNQYKLNLHSSDSSVTITDDGLGDVNLQTAGGAGAVTSVFTRTGAVTAQTGDYSFSQVSGTASASQIPSLDASKITTGQLAPARGGTGVDLSASGSSTAILAQDASHVISARSLIAADIPALDASKITTGQVALARGGTGVDLSATGGSNSFLAQDGSHVVSARRPTDADLSISDITTNNVSTSAHGFAPKAPNDATKFLDGTGAYSVPTGSGISAPNFSTAGQGYFFGPGAARPILTTELLSVSLVASANQVVIVQMILPFQITVRNCSWSKGGGTNTKHHSFGIYDASGNKLIAAAFTNTATAALIETVSFTGVVLTPGVYWFAQADEDAATSGNGQSSPSTVAFDALFSKVGTHMGVAANAATSGALPATLGAITAQTTAPSWGIAMPLWET